MKKIPKEAMPIVELIRKTTKRPKRLPLIFSGGGGGALRWIRSRKLWSSRWGKNKERCCPMGLIPTSTYCCPTNQNDLGSLKSAPPTLLQVQAFFSWWDRIKEKDAKKAMDAVWGKE